MNINLQKSKEIISNTNFLYPYHHRYDLPEDVKIQCEDCGTLTLHSVVEEISTNQEKCWCIECLMKDLYTRPATIRWYREELTAYFDKELLDAVLSTFECCVYGYDNVRIAPQDDAEALDLYQKRRSNGCCGFLDKDWTGPDGKEYKIGCNYGH